MGIKPPPDEQAIAEIAETLAVELKKLLYPREYFEKMRQLKTLAEKLVYLYILLTQPQTFSGVKQGLGICKASAAKALQKLERMGLIAQDSYFLYWITVGKREHSNSL
jgi:hypothetical protein